VAWPRSSFTGAPANEAPRLSVAVQPSVTLVPDAKIVISGRKKQQLRRRCWAEGDPSALRIKYLRFQLSLRNVSAVSLGVAAIGNPANGVDKNRRRR
jgi:hypothetical protein